jgi:hypothetical protein
MMEPIVDDHDEMDRSWDGLRASLVDDVVPREKHCLQEITLPLPSDYMTALVSGNEDEAGQELFEKYLMGSGPKIARTSEGETSIVESGVVVPGENNRTVGIAVTSAWSSDEALEVFLVPTSGNLELFPIQQEHQGIGTCGQGGRNASVTVAEWEQLREEEMVDVVCLRHPHWSEGKEEQTSKEKLPYKWAWTSTAWAYDESA